MILDKPRWIHHLSRQILQREELLWVNFTLSNEIRIDVHQVALADFQASLHQHPILEGQIIQMNFLRAGRAFDLNEIPRIFGGWTKDVGAAIPTIGRER